MTPSIDLYVTWVMYAVLGMLAEADVLMRADGDRIRHVAWFMRNVWPVDCDTLYRGVLLERDRVGDGVVAPHPQLTFASFTEDRNVACWFADPHSFVGAHMLAQRPDVEGWIMEHDPEPSEILWHYRWTGVPCPGGQWLALIDAAGQHPQIAPRRNELDWNMRTQREVILEPAASAMRVTPLSVFPRPCTTDLDDWLAPPWVTP